MLPPDEDDRSPLLGQYLFRFKQFFDVFGSGGLISHSGCRYFERFDIEDGLMLSGEFQSMDSIIGDCLPEDFDIDDSR